MADAQPLPLQAPPQIPFSRDEFAQRLERTQRELAKQDLDVLVVTDPCNIYYLTGYAGWSFFTPQVLLVSRDSAPVWIGRKMDILGVKMTSMLSESCIVGYPENLVQSREGHPLTFIAEHLCERGWTRHRVGLEKGSYYLSVQGFEAFTQRLPRSCIVDASLLVNWVRFHKSPAEIQLMREAGRLLDRSLEAAYAAIVPGARECDVAAAIYAAHIGGDASVGGVYSSTPPLVMTGERTATPHLPWTDAPLKEGTQVHLELMGNRLRYQVTMGRTAYLGMPPQSLLRLEEIAIEVIQEVLQFIRPGLTCADVSDRALRALRKHGIEKESRLGYSQGIAFPPTGGELTASIRGGDQTMLEPGVALHFLPAIWTETGSILISEPFVVTQSGVERFCHTPREVRRC